MAATARRIWPSAGHERLRDWRATISATFAAVGWRLRRQVRSAPLPSRPLVTVAVALAGGCVAGRGVPGPWGCSTAVAWWLLAAACLGGWWLARGWRPALLIGAVACAGATWSAARFDLFRADEIAWQLGDVPVPIALRGTVVEPFRALPAAERAAPPRAAAAVASECAVAIDAVRDGSRWRPATGLVTLVVDGAPPPVRAGSRVRAFGRGLRPRPALNPGEPDDRLRARARRNLALVRVPAAACIDTLVAPVCWSPAALLDDLRSAAAGALSAHVSADRLALARALILGGRDTLPRADTEAFVITGTVHVLSISGLHVGLLALGVTRMLRWTGLRRAWALSAVAVLTGLYMLVVGAETPVVRATLLVWLACLAAALGRRAPVFNGLAFAGIVVLVWRPAEVFGVGAQLSFLCTGVLVGVAGALAADRMPRDPIDRLVERSRGPLERRLRRLAVQTWHAFLASAAVWLASAPLVAERFHLVTPAALVVNLLVAPLVPAAMVCGFLCLLVAPLSTWLAAACGAGCDTVLMALQAVVAAAARVPGGHAWVAGPPAWWVAGWYVALAVLLVALPLPRLCRPSTWAVAAATWAAVGLLAPTGAPAPGPGVRAIVAALGHGCGIVVRTPSGRCLVYDAGRLGAPGAARRALEGVLRSEGVSRIDTLVISHADVDHFNAVPDLLGRFAVGELVVGAEFVTHPAAAVIDLLARVRDHGVPVRVARAGDDVPLDPSCRVRVVHPRGAPRRAPRPATAPRNDNGASLVLAVEFAGRRLLLTGDLEGEALHRFNRARPGPCDVLVAPHHGSRTSLPADIARVTRPALVVVSGPGGRSWPEVRAAYAAAAGGCPVLKTGGEGALAVRLTAAGVSVQRHEAGRWQPGVRCVGGSGVRP